MNAAEVRFHSIPLLHQQTRHIFAALSSTCDRHVDFLQWMNSNTNQNGPESIFKVLWRTKIELATNLSQPFKITLGGEFHIKIRCLIVAVHRWSCAVRKTRLNSRVVCVTIERRRSRLQPALGVCQTQDNVSDSFTFFHLCQSDHKCKSFCLVSQILST